MKLQILSKQSMSDCAEIIRMNVDTTVWSWLSYYRQPPGYTIAGKVGLSQFVLKRKKKYPSFFSAIMKGEITDEEQGTRIVVTSSLNLLPKILGILFFIIIMVLFFLKIELPFALKESFFMSTALAGFILFVLGRISIRPDERYICLFLEELFEDDHVWYAG